jgi:hypothetical protein
MTLRDTLISSRRGDDGLVIRPAVCPHLGYGTYVWYLIVEIRVAIRNKVSLQARKQKLLP